MNVLGSGSAATDNFYEVSKPRVESFNVGKERLLNIFFVYSVSPSIFQDTTQMRIENILTEEKYVWREIQILVHQLLG